MLSQHELDRRSNGLSGVEMECSCSGMLSGGSGALNGILCIRGHPLPDEGVFFISSPPPWAPFPSFFALSSAVATASSLGSASTSSSSLLLLLPLYRFFFFVSSSSSSLMLLLLRYCFFFFSTASSSSSFCLAFTQHLI